MHHNDMPTAGLEPARLASPDPKSGPLRGSPVGGTYADSRRTHGSARTSTTDLTTWTAALLLAAVGGGGCADGFELTARRRCEASMAWARTAADSAAVLARQPLKSAPLLLCREVIRPEAAR